jgi:hypothetical protein
MRYSSSGSLCLLFGFTVSAAFINATPAAASSNRKFSASAPEGFEALASEREVVLDAYVGGEKRGEVHATIAPGTLRFEDPRAVAGVVPNVARQEELVATLTGSLPANSSLACGRGRKEGCGMLPPDQTGIILDEERFRVDIFVGSGLLIKPDPAAAVYLPPPAEEPSLISLFGATVSGSSRGDEAWHLQNRSIASVGSVRLRSDSSLSTDSGLSFDNLTVEADRREWRYAGGIFWAPGTELIGRRRIIGLGAMTQLDTLLNKDALEATPLPIYLQQPAKVDVLVDGRIVSSRIYPPGNGLIDTQGMPSGSYNVVLRIQEDGRPARQEQIFFTKGSTMAPLGRPLFSAFAGLLPSSNRGISLEGDTFFYEAMTAYRLTPAVGVDAALLGTQHKAIIEGGATFHSQVAQIRLAALVSSAADYGALIRLTTVGRGPLSFTLDMRKVVSRDDRPLIPTSTSRATFSEDPESSLSDQGTYTQALSILGYRLGRANLRLTGAYRKNESQKASYSIGAAAEFPIVRTGRWDIVLLSDARRSDQGFASFIGARFLANRGNLSVSGAGGISHQADHPGKSDRLVGEAQAAWYRQLANHNQVSGNVAIGRDIDASYARASAYARSDKANARVDLLRQFGDHQTTQYTATVESGIALAGSGFGMAGRDMNDTAAIVSVGGGEAGQKFEVLVDEVARGTIAAGDRVMLFLKPYQSYEVRIRPRGAGIAAFDAAPRKITLYPGNVSRLDWDVTPLFILFGRAMGTEGRPLAHADISGTHGIGRTDGEGYFQIETNGRDQLRIATRDGPSCLMTVPATHPVNGLVSAGDIKCR